MLAVEDIDEIRRLVEAGADLPARIDEPTLAAATELACTAWQWTQREEKEALRAFTRWSTAWTVIGLAWRALNGELPFEGNFAPRHLDVRSVTNVEESSGLATAFTASLKAFRRITHQDAQALSGGFEEMIDNVFQHSTERAEVAAPAIMAFDVAKNGSFSFAVADVGRGVLASLRSNQVWNDLPDDEAAVRAVVRAHASRRPGSPGGGFKHVVRALADWGRLRLRTGNTYVVVEGGFSQRAEALGENSPLIGAQIVVSAGAGTLTMNRPGHILTSRR